MKKKLFTPRQLVGKLPFPLPQSYLGILKLINQNEAEFKPTIFGEGHGKRYYISEKNLKSFLKKYSDKFKK